VECFRKYSCRRIICENNVPNAGLKKKDLPEGRRKKKSSHWNYEIHLEPEKM